MQPNRSQENLMPVRYTLFEQHCIPTVSTGRLLTGSGVYAESWNRKSLDVFLSKILKCVSYNPNLLGHLSACHAALFRTRTFLLFSFDVAKTENMSCRKKFRNCFIRGQVCEWPTPAVVTSSLSSEQGRNQLIFFWGGKMM